MMNEKSGLPSGRTCQFLCTKACDLKVCTYCGPVRYKLTLETSVTSLSLGYVGLCYCSTDVLTLIYRVKITVKYNYCGMGKQSVEERFCLTGELGQHLLTHAYA
jgi:hypothetical protein